VAGTVGPALPRSSATSHELARVELLAGLPGQTLGKLAKQMVREEIAPGTAVIREGDPGERFYVVFAGMLTVTNSSMGEREILRPGDYFGEVALAMDVPRTATVTAMTPAVVASCDRATFDELLRPLFADD
jgi:CRP-like cAMP-binding protein